MKRNHTKTYTSSTVETSCQFEIAASSVKEAKEKAKELAGDKILFDSECVSPESNVLPIYDDAVEA